MKKLNFQVDEGLLCGIERLKPMLNFEYGNEITVRAEQGERIGVTLKDGNAVIYYKKKFHFFRELGLLVQHAETETELDLTEDGWFDCLSTMLDTSRNAVPTVDTIFKMLDYFALMGYGMVMLYTEDTVELKNRPYFGYMRGRYSLMDLRAIDDYADAYGIEVIPCLECYGHMEKYLVWPEAAPIKDTERVLLAREEKTFEFLEELISTVSACFRSKRIHIGMDEAFSMGRGTFLDRHHYVDPFEIFTEYLKRLVEITNKYGLQPMMWSDMYFRNGDPNRKYYEKETVVPPEVAAQIPEEVELVFWHYGEKPYCDDYMLKKHRELGRKIIYAGGLWNWIGHFPEHNYVMETVRFSLEACRNNDVHEAMMTHWLNDNAECDYFAPLFGYSFFAELCYNKEITDAELKARFEAVTGGNYDAFYAMSFYHNKFENGEEYPNFHDRFFGKAAFWQDIMEGLYDTHLFERPMSGHYAAAAARMKQYADGKWDYLYDFAAKCFDYLALKTEIAEKLYPAYQAGDRATLKVIAEQLLPALKEKTLAVHGAHRTMWHAHNKALGWSALDFRYGGMASRCDTAKLQLEQYLSGEVDRLEQLEQKRLYKQVRGFSSFLRIATPNQFV